MSSNLPSNSSVRAEHLDSSIEVAVPLRPAQETDAFHQDLLGGWRLAEQLHHLVHEPPERQVTLARRLARREFGLYRRWRELNHLDLALELLAQRHRVGMDRR